MSPYGIVVAQNAPIVLATNRFLELSSSFDREFRLKFYRAHIAPAPRPLGLRTMERFNRLLEKEIRRQQQ